jgi:uncharacterized membrane protein YhhN
MSGHGPVVVLGIAAGLVAMVNWWSRWRDAGRVELITKPLATILIGAFAIACAMDGQHAPRGALIAGVIGFVCCLAGDVALLPAVDKFVVGLGAFLVGHLAFVVMFVFLDLDRWWLGAIAVVGTVVVAMALGRRIVAGAVAKAPEYAMPVRAYLLVISAMAIVGWATGRPAAVLGATAFITSDAILGWEVFVDKRRWMPLAIMVTYHAALAGLAMSLL